MLEQVFTPEQIEKLDGPIDAKRVAHRQGGGGSTLSYIEGHEAIDAANRIFSYGNWGFEIVGTPTRDHYTDTNGEIKAMWYTAKVRLHVRGCEPIEEMGLVEVQLPKPGRESSFGQQVDVAMKGAITDALKRALRCYGDQFGNSLYDKALIDGQVKPTNSQNRPTTPTVAQVTQSAPAPINRTTPPPSAPQPAKTVTAPAPNQVSNFNPELATEQQLNGIRTLARNKKLDEFELRKRSFDLYGRPVEKLDKSDAAHFIKVLQGAEA